MAGKKTDSFLKGELTQVDVAAIEKQLKELWQHAVFGEENTIMRACTSNFIMLTDSDEGAADTVLSEILTQHPSRAVLAIFQVDKKSKVDAWVSARCHLSTPKGDDKVCSEQITVHASGGSTEQLASVIRPLIVSDLPVFLWWRMSRLHNDLLRPLASMADALIVDSNCDALNQDIFDSILPMTAGRTRLQALDINWVRLNAWQRALANAFDGYPLEVFELTNIESIAIHYTSATEKGVSNQALLLAGWIAGRLHWVDSSGHGKKLKFKVNGAERTIEFVPRTSAAEKPLDNCNGHVVEIAATLSDQRTLSVTAELAGDSGAMLARVYAGKNLTSESTPAKLNYSEAQLVVRQLETPGTDTVFGDSLKLAIDFGKHLK